MSTWTRRISFQYHLKMKKGVKIVNEINFHIPVKETGIIYSKRRQCALRVFTETLIYY